MTGATSDEVAIRSSFLLGQLSKFLREFEHADVAESGIALDSRSDAEAVNRKSSALRGLGVQCQALFFQRKGPGDPQKKENAFWRSGTNLLVGDFFFSMT